jgi:hypothetical protein
MTEQQRSVMMDDLIHSVKVAIYHHQEKGNTNAALALFEEYQEWILGAHFDVTLIDSVLPA